MKNFPSNKVIIGSIVTVIVYLTVDFYYKGHRDFFQLNYDWDALSKIKTYNGFTLDSTSYNFVKISYSNETDIDQLNSDDTFAVNDTYYFRCAYLEVHNNEIEFKGVHWINSMPKTEFEHVKFSIVNLDLKQKGDKTVCFLGDSQFTWLDGKYTRKEISKKIRNIKFVGNHKDVFGYPYEATLLNNTKLVLKEIDNIPLASIYVVFIGAHEDGIPNTSLNLISIIQKLTDLGSEVIFIKPPIYLNETKKRTNIEIEKAYEHLIGKSNVKIIDISEILTDTNEYLQDDGIHINAQGQQILVDELIETLNKTHK